VDPYARMCADREVMRHIGDGAPLTRKGTEAQISHFVSRWEEHGIGPWAAEDRATGAFLGFIGLAFHEDWPEGQHKTEVGWRLDRRFWGRGLATEGALASLRYGFGELGLERIICIVQPANAASRRVAEKVGLCVRGTTRWRGAEVVWYAADRAGWHDPRRGA